MQERSFQSNEIELPQEVIGPKAYELIELAISRLKDCEELKSALVNMYFLQADHSEYSMWRPSINLFDTGVSFAKGNNKFSISRVTESEREELQINVATEDNYYSVRLEAHIGSEARRFNLGGIQLITLVNEARKLTTEYNTQKAIDKVTSFLDTYFPEVPNQPRRVEEL